MERLALVEKPSALRCPLCHDPLEVEPRACSDCHTAYHATCLEELGGCSTLGCASEGRKPKVRVTLTPRPTEREEGFSTLRWLLPRSLLVLVYLVFKLWTISDGHRELSLSALLLGSGVLAVAGFVVVYLMFRTMWNTEVPPETLRKVERVRDAYRSRRGP